MINNSGDMTNKISDERLKELLLDCRRDGSSVVAADISEMEAGQIIEELLSLRSLNKKLVEDGERLADCINAMINMDAERAIELHTALMKEIGGWEMDNSYEILKRVLSLPKYDKSYAYKMGFDCAVNGANTTNCNFAIFSCIENTREWERGNRDGEKSKETA